MYIRKTQEKQTKTIVRQKNTEMIIRGGIAVYSSLAALALYIRKRILRNIDAKFQR